MDFLCKHQFGEQQVQANQAAFNQELAASRQEQADLSEAAEKREIELTQEILLERGCASHLWRLPNPLPSRILITSRGHQISQNSLKMVLDESQIGRTKIETMSMLSSKILLQIVFV